MWQWAVGPGGSEAGPIAGSLYRHVICVCALKASKEAGQALVCKANPNFDVHHHHLLHCLEKTTVRTHTHTHLWTTYPGGRLHPASVSASEPRVCGREDVRGQLQGRPSGEAGVSLLLHLLVFLTSRPHFLLRPQEEEDLHRPQFQHVGGSEGKHPGTEHHPVQRATAHQQVGNTNTSSTSLDHTHSLSRRPHRAMGRLYSSWVTALWVVENRKKFQESPGTRSHL